jgi:hypothetical protein
MAMRVPSTGISQEVSLGSVPFNPAVDRNSIAGNGVLFAAPQGILCFISNMRTLAENKLAAFRTRLGLTSSLCNRNNIGGILDKPNDVLTLIGYHDSALVQKTIRWALAAPGQSRSRSLPRRRAGQSQRCKGRSSCHRMSAFSRLIMMRLRTI